MHGLLIEPIVSLPMENATPPAAVAAAGPALEPLEPDAGFQGLRVRPPYHTSPIASSPSESFASNTAPASSSFFTTVASKSNTCSAYGLTPNVVGIPFVASRSFAPHGSPCRGPRHLPAAIS